MYIRIFAFTENMMDILILPTTPFDVEALLNIDYSKYTTELFLYNNMQHHYEDSHFLMSINVSVKALFVRRCLAQYVKCTANL